MIIIIPLGGTGERFKKANYEKPKALIEVEGKPILFYLLDNLIKSEYIYKIHYIYIPYNKEYANYNFEKIIKDAYPKILFKFFLLEKNTRGAAETILLSLQNEKMDHSWIVRPDFPILCLDSDNFYTCDIIKLWDGKNSVFTFKDTNSEGNKFSYVYGNTNISDIVEKQKISDNACCGAYGFDSILTLKNYCQKIINKNIRQNGEFYTSGVIKEMLNDNLCFTNINVLNKNYFSLGTPEQVEEYTHPYLFDFDGTLVNTDYIYIKVWKEIMEKYQLSVDSSFFNFFIQGKNDMLFLKSMFPNIKNNEIKEISEEKDNLFIKYLELNNNENIFIEGAKYFIEKNRNRRMCIVTSCNKKSVEYILKKTNIEEYFQFVIASDDITYPKPNKEPYEKAINILNCEKNKCTIFEDSLSGYKSAKSLGGTKICLVINNVHSNNLINSNEYKITNFNDFTSSKLNPYKKKDNIINLLENKLKNFPIKNIIESNVNLKTGYICDIKSLKLVLNDIEKDVILKISNNDNDLAKVAKKIDLYNKEIYFYENISPIINVDIPEFYCSLEIKKNNAILLENINFNGSFNLNLNNNIDLALLLVKNICKMHNRFCFKNEEEIIPLMKNLVKINEINYYNELIDERFDKFININSFLLTERNILILKNIKSNFKKISDLCSTFPLNFCHGDLKSPNIFYRNSCENKNDSYSLIFLDWQYIHLNKGISDIVFLLVESTNFNEILNDIILKYYYQKSKIYKNYEQFMFDYKLALCTFPFFVMVWFNSENRDNLLDKVFPINFMKNLIKFYEKYLDELFFNSLKNY